MDKYIKEDEFRALMYHKAFEEETEFQKWDSGCWIRYKLFEQALDEMPSADVRKNISVRLIIEPRLGLKCPNCNSIISETDYHFCPWCGSEILGIDFGKWEYKFNKVDCAYLEGEIDTLNKVRDFIKKVNEE